MTASGQAPSRTVYVRILGDCDVKLWGLTSHQRLRRQLASAASCQDLAEAATAPAAAAVLLLRADWLYDQRTLQDLLTRPSVLLQVDRGGQRHTVAAHVPSEYLAATEPVIAAGSGSVAGLAVETPETLSSAYVQKLLKADRPVVAKISPDKQALLERHLFDGSYKGITDLVTKWVWPAPARAVVRACVTLGIRPNAVTLTSLVLVLIVLGLFATGRFGSGLVLAWIMTFLDTVDGKLARVTIDSSALGHALDKGIDLIHPPLWYIAWGIGAFEAGRFGGSPGLLIDGSVVILAGYIGGRLLEGAFDFYLGKFPIYSWQPLDSYVRLIIARRNPNLLLLTAFLIAGSPGSGMLAVAAWTAISTVFLASRVGYAAYLRATSGPLQSWLRHPDHSAAAARTFSASNAGLTRALESGS